MNTQALWQTLKPFVPYAWLLVLWARLTNTFYFVEANVPVIVAVIVTVLMSTMFTAIAALVQVTLTAAVKSLWANYQYQVRTLENRAKREQEGK